MPLPDPLDPEITLSHDGALLLAVQAQPEEEVTLTVAEPADEDRELLLGEMV